MRRGGADCPVVALKRGNARGAKGAGKIKWGYQYTPNDPYDFDEISEHPIINAKVNGEDRKLVVHAARNGFFYALDRTNGSFIAGKQYVDELNWTPGLDPKTGRPLSYNPNTDIQIYAPGSHSMRGQPSIRTCPSNVGGKNWEPSAYNPELGLMFIPSIEGCNTLETLEQKDMEDQGGTVKARERFTGGSSKTVQRLYGSLKAVDPITGETKASLKMDYPNYGGALATAGNLVFLGEPDGTISRRLQTISQAFERAGIPTPLTATIRVEIWDKLVRNLSTSPICALTGEPIGVLGRHPELLALAKGLMREGLAVCAAHGIHIDLDLERAYGARPSSTHKSSMLQDFERDRPPEIDGLLTAVQAFARTAGIATPHLDAITALIIEKARRMGLYPPAVW